MNAQQIQELKAELTEQGLRLATDDPGWYYMAENGEIVWVTDEPNDEEEN